MATLTKAKILKTHSDCIADAGDDEEAKTECNSAKTAALATLESSDNGDTPEWIETGNAVASWINILSGSAKTLGIQIGPKASDEEAEEETTEVGVSRTGTKKTKSGEEWIKGIPNWAVILGIVVLLLAMVGGIIAVSKKNKSVNAQN
jgi:hypothetical protein